MFCKYCGKEVNEEFVACPYCGKRLKEEAIIEPIYNQTNPNYNNQNSVDSGSIGWAFLGFFIPLVGLILYLVWKDDKPKTSKMAGKGALIAVIVEAVAVVVFYVCFFVFLGSIGTWYY